MTEEIERITEKEVSVTFQYKLVRVNDRKYHDEYYVLYMTISYADDKIETNMVLPNDYTVEDILKELKRLNNFVNFTPNNEKIVEGIKEEFLKRIAILLWKW